MLISTLKLMFNTDMSLAKNQKNLLLVTIILTLIAIGFHAYLANHYYELKLGALNDKALCNINDLFNCDTVASSKFATVLSIPMGVWGLITNFIFLILLLLARFNLSDTPKVLHSYIKLLALFIAVTSIVMGGISFIFISALCLFCIITYVLSFASFALIQMTFKESFKTALGSLPTLWTSHKSYLGLVIAIPVMSYIYHDMTMESKGLADLDKIVKEKVAYWKVSPVQNFTDDGLIYQVGSSPAKVTIVEFADFRCPHCKTAAPTIHAFAKNNPDVRLIFKPFPLDGVCNSAISGGDGISCKLAASTICAEKLFQKGWAVHDGIFAAQEQFLRGGNAEETLKKVLADAKLDFDAINQCTQTNEEVATLIRNMAKEGETAKISGTPTIFVNGKLLVGGQMYPILEAAYQDAKSNP
ncbi:MAG: vitamin K epoxide reductase family protein [Bdellovibrionia bacterium]